MARSLSSVKAFFQGLDDGAAQRRLEEEAAAKRKLEAQNFLFRTAAEQRAVEDQAQRGEVFNQSRTARELAVKKAEFEAGQITLNTPVLEADADITRTKALFSQNLFKTNQTELEKNLADAAKNKLGQDALGIGQASVQLKQMQDNPYVFNAALRAGDAQIGAAGIETADAIITKRGLTLPPELAGAGEVTKLQWLENSGKFLNKTQAEITATQKATEVANQAAADRLARDAANNASKETIADGKNTTSTANTAAKIAAKNPSAPAAAAAPAVVAPRVNLGIDSAPLPTSDLPAMPTAPAKAAPAKAAPAPVAQPAPILTPGEQAVDNAKVSYVQLQKEIEALQPPLSTSSRSRNGTPGQVTSAYLAWQASGKPALLQAKQAELQRLNAAFATSLKR